jgi:NAD(P)-dependent dehydrogenase (short-subunit alcohol dehydrogenase family)
MSRHIIISGASGNLGTEVVKRLSDTDNSLYLTLGSKRPDMFDKLENVSAETINLLDYEASLSYVNRVITKAKTVHAGIFLAGAFAMGTMDHTDDVLMEKMLGVNFFTTFHLVKPLMTHFEANGGGQFIFIGARPALEADQGKDSFAYTLSKSLLFKMAELINAEGKSKNITATVIVPSIIDTPPNREAMPDADFTKWIAPFDIAETIAFVLSKSGQKLREPVLKVYNNG